MRYFIVPTYNEAANLPHLARELAPFLADNQAWLVLSDDGSSDGTRELARSLFPIERLTVLGDGTNRGPGHAFNAGFEHVLARAKDEDLIVTMEADCTSDIRILPDMLAIAGLGYDLVLASVYAQGGGFERTTWLRKLLSATANFIYRFIFDLKVSTLSSFYRVYRAGSLRVAQKRYGTLITEHGFICMLELLIKLIRTEARVIEVPMVLASERRIGRSRMKLMRTTLHYFRFLLRFNSRHGRRAHPSSQPR
ncbi:MAG: glycosyltransferase [Flavobacteriales bacterium]|nr:glycosyltransferase [Flavobacteriales bacterium]